MSDRWSFGDELDKELDLQPGQAMCHHCGAPAPEGMPAYLARCQVCKRLLHTCYNCALYNGIGCLVRSLDMHREGAEIGQLCPSFRWRRDAAISPDDVPEVDVDDQEPGPPRRERSR